MSTFTSGLVLYAKDHQRLAEFYSVLLQLQVLELDDEFISLGSDAFELTILQAPAEITERITISSPPQKREDTALKPVFFVERIKKAREVARRTGGYVDPASQAWRFRNYTVCDGFDPEGNVFQLRAPVETGLKQLALLHGAYADKATLY